jgi:dTDP-glucose 4,6-dehydratase
MDILVTGINGLIGGAVFNSLEGQGFYVFGTYNTKGKYASYKNCFQMDLIEGANQLTSCFPVKFDLVIHCAAYLPLNKSISEAEKCRSLNKIIDSHIFSYCKENDSRLFYMSGAYIYKRSPKFKSETDDIFPIGGYLIQKSISESQIHEQIKDFVILRISSPFGTNISKNVVMNVFIKKALNNEDILLHGLGERTQDFIYIKEIEEVIEKLIESDLKGVYNLVSSLPISMKELAETIVDISKSKSVIKYLKAEEGQSFNNFSNHKLYESLNIEPKYNLAQAIKEIIQENVNRDHI